MIKTQQPWPQVSVPAHSEAEDAMPAGTAVAPLPFLAAHRPRMTPFQIAALALLFVCAVLLRWYGNDRFPYVNQTGDEYHYAWVGLSLLHGDPPTAWSYLNAYHDRHLHIGKLAYRNWIFQAVAPAFDHPPLYSLVLGAFARLTGAHQTPVPIERYVPDQPLMQFKGDIVGTYQLWVFQFGRIRQLSVILFAWAFLMLFGVAYRAYSYGAAFWTCLFYATIAHVVIHQRLAVTESLLVPLLLTNIYVLQSWLAGKISAKRFGVWTIVLCAAAPLTKLIAFGHPAIVLYLLLIARKRRETIFPIVGAALGLLLYLGYGRIYGWEAFWAVLRSQSDRFLGFDSIEYIILKPFLFQTRDLSYILLVGWIAVFAAAYAARGATLLAAPLIYLGVFVFFASSTGIWGWHLLVFYPFLCLGLGLLADQGWRGDNTMAYMLIMILLLPFLFQTWFMGANKSNPALFRYAYLAVMGLMVAGVQYAPEAIRRWGYRIATTAVIGLVLFNEVHRVWKLLP